MAKKKRNKKTMDSSNKTFIIFMTIALVVLLVVWIVKDTNIFKFNKETGVTEVDYNKKLNEVSLSDALELIQSDKLVFIYIGYEGCSSCDKFTPNLIEIANNYDMKVYYIDIKKVDLDSKEWTTFTNKLTKKITLNIKENGKTKKKTKKIGEFLKNEGYTPSFVVLKNNKFVDGYIGALYKEKLEDFLDNAGFKQK